MRITSSVLLASALLSAGCAGTYIPHHGGGKRFYFEQDLLARTAEEALEVMDFSALRGKSVGLQVFAIGDEGGATVEGGLFASVFGGGVAGGSTPAVGGAALGSTPTQYGAFAFANARDMEFLKGRILNELLADGVDVVTSADTSVGWVYVLVDVFGTMRWSRDFLVYNEEHLSGRVRLQAFYLGKEPVVGDDGSLGPDYIPLGKSAAKGDFELAYLLRCIQLTPNPAIAAHRE